MMTWKTKTRLVTQDQKSMGMVDMIMVLDGEGVMKCALSGEINQEDEKNFVRFAASPVLENALRKIDTVLAPGESDPEQMAEMLQEVSRLTVEALAALASPSERGVGGQA